MNVVALKRLVALVGVWFCAGLVLGGLATSAVALVASRTGADPASALHVDDLASLGASVMSWADTPDQEQDRLSPRDRDNLIELLYQVLATRAQASALGDATFDGIALTELTEHTAVVDVAQPLSPQIRATQVLLEQATVSVTYMSPNGQVVGLAIDAEMMRTVGGSQYLTVERLDVIVAQRELGWTVLTLNRVAS